MNPLTALRLVGISFKGDVMTTCAAKKSPRYLRNTRAVSALEYAILMGIIALTISAALVTFSGNITPVLSLIGGKIGATTVDSGTAK